MKTENNVKKSEFSKEEERNLIYADKYPNGEKVVGAQRFEVKTTFLGDVYINGVFYKQLCFTPNQVALAIEDFLNGIAPDTD